MAWLLLGPQGDKPQVSSAHHEPYFLRSRRLLGKPGPLFCSLDLGWSPQPESSLAMLAHRVSGGGLGPSLSDNYLQSNCMSPSLKID